MERRFHNYGFTFVEFLVVLVVLAVVASIIFPIFASSGRHSTHGSCNSNVRQLATAVQMYVQDNHKRFPGMVAGSGATANNPAWEDALLTYVGSKKIYFCPSDTFRNKDVAPISYGYNGLLVDAAGRGLPEAQVKSPVEVGAICDAGPTKAWGFGGLVGGGGLCGDADTVKPMPRHGGVIVGYCDGHAKFQPGKNVDLRDTGSLVTRGFYMANALGLVDNPAGGLRSFGLPDVPKASIVVGGDYCTRPLLVAAAQAWRQKTGSQYSGSFSGQYVPHTGENYVWGCSDGSLPQGQAVAIARDALVVIVSKNSKIKRPGSNEPFLGDAQDSPFQNNAYAVTPGQISRFFDARVCSGYSADAWQAYIYNTKNGNRRYFDRVVAPGTHPGKEVVIVENDEDMVNRVAADPYGIGYCSSVFADLDRVQTLGIKHPDGKTYLFPSDNPKYRWNLPKDPDWPYVRTLYAVCGKDVWGARGSNTFARLMLAPGGPGTKALQAGPLFQASYLLPR
ncbi:MAG: prepilin-type N-terminal cleavage/methylation domain-containing protein [Armatimonadota bacterium]